MSDSLLLVDLEGNSLAFLEPTEVDVTRQWNGGASLNATLDVRDPKTELIIPGATALQWWFEGELRFHGQIGEPLTSNEKDVKLAAADPWDVLAARKLQADETYTNEDAGAIAWASVATENARAATGIQEGTISPTTSRSMTFTAGTTRADLITQLTQLDGGFGFTLDPVADVPGVLAELNIYGISQVSGYSGGPRFAGRDTSRMPSGGGAVRPALPGVRFEFGDGTLDNCDGFEENVGRPRNRIVATGQALSDGTRPQGVAEDTTSQDEYGLWEYEVSVNSTDTTVLYAHALAELRPDPIATYTMKPTPEAPLLFRDFDVGNTVYLTIRHGRVNVTGSARADACTIKRDSSDWRIDSITLSSPLVQRIARNANDGLENLLKGYAGRIGVLERAHIVGS